MSFELPSFARADFHRQIDACSPEALTAEALDALFGHYEELRRWNRRLALLGSGTAADVIERHYGESLAALPLIPIAPGRAVDLGSGAGFPGFPVAAARPALRMTLNEARQRKASFLLAAIRRAALPVRCLNARVTVPWPEGFPESLTLVTVRALKLSPELLAELGRRLDPDGRILMWVGRDEPSPAEGLAVARQIALPGSERRRIVELVRAK